jgi:hypothetical protein
MGLGALRFGLDRGLVYPDTRDIGLANCQVKHGLSLFEGNFKVARVKPDKRIAGVDLLIVGNLDSNYSPVYPAAY